MPLRFRLYRAADRSVNLFCGIRLLSWRRTGIEAERDADGSASQAFASNPGMDTSLVSVTVPALLLG
ncbi:hypothetical protein ASD64_14740 [Mesorhizobium sp. Root157]|nr:hypothetical protein ASD64_14740 [Mesorhizobium sp. Root157]